MSGVKALEWFRRPNARQQDKPTDDGDAICTIAIRPADHNTVAEKLSNVRWVRLLKGAQAQQSHVSNNPQLQHSGFQPNLPGDSHTLLDIPDSAALSLWRQLPSDTRRTLLLVSQAARRVFARCVSSLHLSSTELSNSGGCAQLGQLHEAFPGLNELHLHLGSDFDCVAARHLRRSQLPLLHTLYVDSKLRGDTFHAVAKLIVQCPNLKVLRLPNQRCSSATDQRILAAVIEALPALTELDLGGSICSSSSGANNAITPSVMRRITRLRNLVSLSCNASVVPDSNLEALANLRCLESLHMSAAGPATRLAAAVGALTRLESLELQHPSITDELLGSIGRLRKLQVLAVGLCPKITDDIMQEVCQLKQLQKVTLPFPLGASHLRLLSRLPALQHLYSWRHLELDILGPAHNPLNRVQQLVCHSIQGRGKQLGAWFPNLESLVLKHCSDMEALSLKGCVGLQTLMAGECGQLSAEGFACIRDCKGLQRLQLEGASQVSQEN
eukprot:GHUV01011132.1.p1 GENE.GHUV01011132.1~~GHUV01011132.1.p1  ORF type:complete len:499 (+),score=127.34 GHUV01011132.1:198-1694(+)